MYATFSLLSAIEKPNHCPEAIAVLIPITFPDISISGPQEFPGLIAVSVCMSELRLCHPAWIILSFPLTTPKLTEF